MKPMFALINGAACRYLVTGAGPATIVLVHELGGSLDSYDRLAALLPTDLRVVRYDMRGAGLSEKVSGTLDLDVMADDIAALLDHLAIDGRISLLGTAVGTAIAVRFATRHAGRIDRLILAAPSFGLPSERREAALEMTNRLDQEGMRSIAETALPRVFPSELWDEAGEKSAAEARWLGADPQGYAAAYRMLVDNPVRAELGRIACPTLVIAGEHDPYTPPDAAALDARTIPNARFTTIEAGHFMTIQSPGLVAPLISDFWTPDQGRFR